MFIRLKIAVNLIENQINYTLTLKAGRYLILKILPINKLLLKRLKPDISAEKDLKNQTNHKEA
jgi:hypothetical protein